MTPKRLKILLALPCGLLALAGALGLSLRYLSLEPSAASVPSLVAQLEAHSVVAVLSHPDDENWVAGFLDDAGHRPDVKAHLITATRGEKGIAGFGVSSAELAEIREAEVRAHGAALGLVEQEVWHYGDSALAAVPEDQLVQRIAQKLFALRADVVLTFEPESGFTAHPDHLRIGHATRRAFCEAAKDATGPRWLVYVLAPRRLALIFGGERGRWVATHEPEPRFAMRIAPAIKLRAWRIHHSQRDYFKRMLLPPWLFYRIFDEELYTVRDAATACAQFARPD